jgi:hypothetical protein
MATGLASARFPQSECGQRGHSVGSDKARLHPLRRECLSPCPTPYWRVIRCLLEASHSSRACVKANPDGCEVRNDVNDSSVDSTHAAQMCSGEQ